MNFLIVIPNENYLSDLISVLRNVYEKEEDKILYITLNRPYQALVMSFFHENLDNKKFFFIDAITKQTTSEPEKFIDNVTDRKSSGRENISNCKFVSLPTAFEEIFSNINVILREFKFQHVVFDSLSSLTIYSKEDDAIRFVHQLISKLSVVANCEVSFLCLKSDVESKLVSKMSLVVDKVIDLGKI